MRLQHTVRPRQLPSSVVVISRRHSSLPTLATRRLVSSFAPPAAASPLALAILSHTLSPLAARHQPHVTPPRVLARPCKTGRHDPSGCASLRLLTSLRLYTHSARSPSAAAHDFPRPPTHKSTTPFGTLFSGSSFVW
ncbi:hypothetical protein FOMPIDRAFT_1026072, partial [Fomitopsis schrenkii]